MATFVELKAERRGELDVYPFLGARNLGVDAFVTSRQGGVSSGPYDSLNLGTHVGDDFEAVEENRSRVARAIGSHSLVTCSQVHSNTVVDALSAGPSVKADAISTPLSGIALATLVADCVPLVLVDETSSHYCVVHAGWRGLASGVIANAIASFPAGATLHAFVGPCISARSYQVGPEVAANFSQYEGAVLADEGDRSRLDLLRITHLQLTGAGVLDERITFSLQSTDGGGLFFSDRAQRPCGRFALVAKRAS